MTINGPAPMILAFFMNAAIDQLCEKWITNNNDWDRVNKIIEEKLTTISNKIKKKNVIMKIILQLLM